MNDRPRVSVVLPVRDRREQLAAALAALARQTFGDFEVIVVDDGSTDGSGDVAAAAAGVGVGVRVVRTPGVGAVRARSLGVEAAAGDVFAFTDSDCAPEPEWLAAGVAAIHKGADVVQGVTVPARGLGPLERSISHSGTEHLFATCNVFYRREAYERAGGFDREAGGRLGFRAGAGGRALGFGEDTLLGWRVAREGRAVPTSEARVRHAVDRPSVRELLWRAWMAGGFPALVREVPELRGTLLRQGVFLGWRRLPVYAVVLSAALGQREFAGAAALWWAWARSWRTLRRRRGSWRRRLLSVPVEMAVDVTTAASLAWGSARSRSLVL